MKLFHQKSMTENRGEEQEQQKDNLPAKSGPDYFINQITIWIVIAFLVVLLVKKFI